MGCQISLFEYNNISLNYLMPTTTTTRKKRVRKAPLNKSTAKLPLTEDVKVEEVQEVKKIVRTYPRDGLSIILYPILLLEKGVKEILKATNTIK